MANNNDKKVLNVPALRFPEFADKWEKGYFKDVCKITTGNKNTQDKDENGLYPFYVRSQNIERINSWTFDGEAILTAGDGVGVGKVFHYSIGKIGVHQRVYILSNFKCDGKYLYQYFSSRFYNHVKRMSAKNSVDSVRMEMIADMPLYLPSVGEQHKIGKLLALLDERISTQNKIIEKLQSLIRGIVTKICSGAFVKGKYVFLRDILIERHIKNIENYEVYSVSVSQGIINQIDYLGRSFASKETLHYNVVNYGDIVYTKSPTGDFPYGIVKRSHIQKPIAVSPLYGVYQPKNDYIGKYLHLYFKSPINTKNYLHRLIQKGAKNTINITNSHFLDNNVFIPEKPELINIVNLTSAIEDKLVLASRMLDSLKSQKGYLLSKMFI